MFKNNILITNIGRRGYLVKFLKDISYFEGKIFVSDCDKTASGLYGENDGFFILSKPSDNPDKYVVELIDLCKKENISIIFPVIDPEIDILSRYRDKFQKNDIFVAVSSNDVVELCYNKKKMNEFLLKEGFDIPKTYYSIQEFESGEELFPVIIKPIFGSGSISTYKINDKVELVSLFEEGMMIQEFIDGTEYGIDVLNNLDCEPIRCVVKKKISMRSGETDKAVVVKNNIVQDLIIKMARKLGHICNLDCDVLFKDGKVYFIDLNPRFGGGYPATHMSNVNYLDLIIKMVNGENVREDFDGYDANILVMKEISLVTTEVDDNE